MAEQHFAVLDVTNTVISVIVADSAFVAAHTPGAIRVDKLVPEPGIGWSFAGGVFSPPILPTPPPAIGSSFSRLAFRLLFTSGELQAVDNFANTPGLSPAQKASVNTELITFAQSDLIDLASPHVIAAVSLFGTLGLITSARATAILATRI